MAYEDCEIGRKMEINVAKMQNDIEYIKKTNEEQSGVLKQILDKFDNLDNKYANKSVEDKVNWAIGTAITTLITVIGFLIKILLF